MALPRRTRCQAAGLVSERRGFTTGCRQLIRFRTPWTNLYVCSVLKHTGCGTGGTNPLSTPQFWYFLTQPTEFRCGLTEWFFDQTSFFPLVRDKGFQFILQSFMELYLSTLPFSQCSRAETHRPGTLLGQSAWWVLADLLSLLCALARSSCLLGTTSALRANPATNQLVGCFGSALQPQSPGFKLMLGGPWFDCVPFFPGEFGCTADCTANRRVELPTTL